jgi:hypothetical protein
VKLLQLLELRCQKASCTRDSGLHPMGKGAALALTIEIIIIDMDTAIAIIVRTLGRTFSTIITTTYKPLFRPLIGGLSAKSEEIGNLTFNPVTVPPPSLCRTSNAPNKSPTSLCNCLTSSSNVIICFPIR